MEWKNVTVTRIGQELIGLLYLSGLTGETKLIGYLRRLIERNWFTLLWGCKSKIQGQIGRLESLSEVVAANFGFYSHKSILLDLGFTLIQYIFNLITFAKAVFQIHIFQVDMNFSG